MEKIELKEEVKLDSSNNVILSLKGLAKITNSINEIIDELQTIRIERTNIDTITKEDRLKTLEDNLDDLGNMFNDSIRKVKTLEECIDNLEIAFKNQSQEIVELRSDIYSLKTLEDKIEKLDRTIKLVNGDHWKEFKKFAEWFNEANSKIEFIMDKSVVTVTAGHKELILPLRSLYEEQLRDKDLWDEQKVDGTISTGDCEPTVKECDSKGNIVMNSNPLVDELLEKYNKDQKNEYAFTEPTVNEYAFTEPTVKECDCDKTSVCHKCGNGEQRCYIRPTDNSEKIEEIISEFNDLFPFYFDITKGDKYFQLESWLRDKLTKL